jgi:hypothetical protein
MYLPAALVPFFAGSAQCTVVKREPERINAASPTSTAAVQAERIGLDDSGREHMSFN